MLLASAAALAAMLLAPGPVQAAPASARPPWALALAEAAQDDPRAAIGQARARLAAAPAGPEAYWAWLALGRAQSLLEQPADAAASIAQAAGQLPQPTPAQARWLELGALQAGWVLDTPARAQERLKALQQRLGNDADPVLACELTELAMVLLIDINSLDEAWLAAEALERCGRATGSATLEATAILSLGVLTRKGHGNGQGEADAFFQRADQALGQRPARLLRSIVAWEHGITLGMAGHWDAGLARLDQAHALSRSIGDDAGMAAADIERAHLHLQRQAPAEALPLLAEARRLLAGHDAGFRLATVARHELQALALLRRPEALAAIERARQWDRDTLPAGERARLVRAMAEANAALGRHAQAWDEVQRSETLAADGRRLATDVQVQRLQTRYATARRAAEIAALRHRSEAAQLALEAQRASQQALWAVIATLAVLMAAGLAWGWRALAQRRSLADLALRDELTGQPNRRAVTAYGQAQFAQARRLGVPLSVAMIDLDHFKQVNDSLGHAGGDAVLRAMVAAARGVLRGQDRLGRWGGEEWLLVMPGTAAAELPAVFQRLRARFAATLAEQVPAARGCSFSMGGAEMHSTTASLEVLVAEADRQVYRAKAAGRDCLRC
jgi:diguanylate cyclase (GGDEF)-like protein